MHPSFDDAVGRARAGDPAAFDQLAAALAPSLVRFASTMLVGDVDSAHDVVQETLLAAWKALPGLRDAEHLKAWLFRVAQRRAVSWLRRQRHRDPARAGRLLEPARPPEEWAAPTGTPGPAETGETRSELRTLVGRLPERYRAPIALCHLEGLGPKETARLLGLRPSALKMRLHRGRRLLRRAYGVATTGASGAGRPGSVRPPSPIGADSVAPTSAPAPGAPSARSTPCRRRTAG